MFEKSFKGHVCKMWQLEQTISGSFWGNTDTINSKKTLEVGVNICWDMIYSGKCNGNLMLKEGSISRFEKVPLAQYRYWQTIDDQEINCFVEEITLYSDCLEREVKSIFGVIAKTKRI